MGKKEFRPAGIGDERIVLDFDQPPTGMNCMMSSLHRLLKQSGHDVSEPMLFGIASGLGFIYWYMKQMPAPFTGAMNAGKFPSIIGRAAGRLGCKWDLLKTTSVRKAHRHLKETLKMDQPAFICADIAYLPHLSAGEEFHFGQHTLLVFGIDEEKDEAYLSDRFPFTHTMSLVGLQRARASNHQPFPAKNKLLRFEIPDGLTPLEELIVPGIRENVDYMLNPPIKNIGVSGMLKWHKMLPKYPEIVPDPEARVHALMEHYIYIETGGTGGGFMRRMYSEFLREAGELTDNHALLEAADDYREIAGLWTSIGNSLLPDEFPNLKKIRQIQCESNRDMEQGVTDAVERVNHRLKDLPGAIARAAEEDILEFDKVIVPVREKLLEVQVREHTAMEKLGGL